MDLLHLPGVSGHPAAALHDQQDRGAETITTHYLFFLGLYRALYLVNWIWRFYLRASSTSSPCGGRVVQTILYCDFFLLASRRCARPCAARFPLPGLRGRCASDLTLAQRRTGFRARLSDRQVEFLVRIFFAIIFVLFFYNDTFSL